MEIINALKETGLVGLGGAGFPTWQKWQAVKDSSESKRFVICNLAEGEPGVFKDEYILQKHLPELIAGIQLARETVGALKAYLFINDKYKKYLTRVSKFSKGKKIEIFIDTGRYLCGEETTLLQVIEGKIRQPRQKPPYPTERGLYGFPTLIDNAETLYRAFLISQGGKELKRFYSVSGDFVGKKVIEKPVNAKIKDLLPAKRLSSVSFARVGGLSGFFVKAEDFDKEITGTGSVEFFNKKRKIFQALVESIAFLKEESCGKCTPCREGIYRIAEAINDLLDSSSLWDRKEIVENIIEIAENAKNSSFCQLGVSISYPVLSAIENFKQELMNE